MCFYNDDWDWVAELCEDVKGPASKPGKCIECMEPIAIGEICRSIYQQEYEECTRCDEDGDDADFDDDGNFIPCDGNHIYGETWNGMICESCCQILKAIEAHEIDEGCPPHARQPSYGGLWDETIEDTDALGKYLVRAHAMFPGIETRSRMFQRMQKAVADA